MTASPARRAALVLGAGLVISLTAGCPAPPPPQGKGEGPGKRHQELALTPAQELELGRRAYKEVLQEHRGQILPADAPEVVRCRKVTERIVRASEIRPLQKEINLRAFRYEWEVNVIRDKQLNAFCLPAGKIGVFTGLLKFADDDELAAVLSHEVAHALAHHSSERLARERKAGKSFLSAFQDLAYNRAQESEADKIGVFLMTFAGYDPKAAVRFWEKMQRAKGGGGGLPEILSTHPRDERRAAALREWVPRALKAKAAYDRGDVVKD